ncbi:CDP-alcohol phosphatidyltransferase family protein [Hoyosella sp. YIM 151337]|uniref:CDP-alcohol phosphatidyltransferase family protein n=1 Tax=Hoyosella sp. YIM 151337 TaxID=2992742 RepID=UPI0022363F34|nr:CDP-alcohol phosphatidyltransferase family protein [Hoyosella sp. YIM 151337]MCW4355870.1 CDP-alcohol phosphatidyltransferase family protein [Hoyosella sp. YIM 151337]
MFDAQLRGVLDAPLKRAAAAIDKGWVTPDRLTTAGLTLGLASAGAAALQWWWLALAMWLTSRLADGLDGPLARRRGTKSGAGGFYDITADFIVYGSTVVGVSLGVAAAYDAPQWPFLLVLLAYYVNGAAFLAFSSIAERYGKTLDDGRSLSFLGGLAEGTETIVVHSLWLVFPMFGWQIALVWAVIVGVSAAHRVYAGYRSLR